MAEQPTIIESSADGGRTRVVHHDSSLAQWTLVVRRPDPRLREYVSSIEGYEETAAAAAIRRVEMPWPGVVLIINFGPPFRLTDPRAPDGPTDYGSFVAGLYDSYVVTESLGLSYCMQVNFTPIGAHLFFGTSMSAIANRMVGLDDLVGAEAAELSERLQRAATWDARFALVEGFIAGRIGRAQAPSPQVVWAWRRLQSSGAQSQVGVVAAELGWSHKHLIAKFREQVGLPPKTVARIARFHRVIRWLDGANPVRWAELAHRAGYFDQAHFNRDFRELAGTTPGEFLRQRLPQDACFSTEPPGDL